MNVKSETCFSKSNGNALSVYSSSDEALNSATYTNNKYGRNLIPYQCDRCNLWHLSPKSRYTQSTECTICTDRNGSLKQLYISKRDAQKRANILFEENGILLNVYSCPHESGFHLTKS